VKSFVILCKNLGYFLSIIALLLFGFFDISRIFCGFSLIQRFFLYKLPKLEPRLPKYKKLYIFKKTSPKTVK